MRMARSPGVGGIVVAVARVGPRVGDVSARYRRARLVTATLRESAVETSGGAGASLRDRRRDTYDRLLDAPEPA
jgi:hypothetical protein